MISIEQAENLIARVNTKQFLVSLTNMAESQAEKDKKKKLYF